MSNSTSRRWRYLEPRPQSAYRQLFIKGTRIRARVIYGVSLSKEEPRTPEQIAADYDIPVEAVHEAIAYCRSKPREIEEDFRREEADMEADRERSFAKKHSTQPSAGSRVQVRRR